MKPMNSKIRRFTVALVGFGLMAVTQFASAMYDPSLGRWINRDPLGETGFEATRHRISPARLVPDANLYAFVRNGPISKVDPEGLVTWDMGPCQDLAFATVCAQICGSQGLQPDCRHNEETTITTTETGIQTTTVSWDSCTCKPPPPPPPKPTPPYNNPPNCTHNKPPSFAITVNPPPPPFQWLPPFPPGGGLPRK
jgi:RHS repeat-associated protein